MHKRRKNDVLCCLKSERTEKGDFVCGRELIRDLETLCKEPVGCKT